MKTTQRPRPQSETPFSRSAPAKPAAPTAGGRPLPEAAQSRMSAAFGHDFSSVRVFADDAAAEASSALGAEAFAAGGDLFFGAGRYDPDGADGRRLLAHELTHVVQQDRFGAGVGSVSVASDAAEREAEAAADRAASGGRVEVRRSPSAAVSRRPEPDLGERRVLTAQNVLKASGDMLRDSNVVASDLKRSPVVPDATGEDLFDEPTGTRAGLEARGQAPARDASNPFTDLANTRAGIEATGRIPPRGTLLPFGSTEIAIGSGNSADAAFSGSVVKGFGRRDKYFEIAEDIRRMGAEVGLSESETMAAVQQHATFGELPAGHPILSHPEAVKLGAATDLDFLETFRANENLVLGTMGRELGARGRIGMDGLYGVAPPAGQPHQGGGLPATLPGALKSSRDVGPRIETYTPEQLEEFTRTGRFPGAAEYVTNNRGQGGRAVAGRGRYLDGMASLTDRWFDAQEGVKPLPYEASASEFMQERLYPQLRLRSRPGPPGRQTWNGSGPGTRGSGESGGGTASVTEAGASAAPHAQAAPEPLLALPAPEPRLALPAPMPAAEAAPKPNVPTPDAPHAGPAPAGEGTIPSGKGAVPAGESGATGAEGGAHATMGQAAGIGAASAGLATAINDLAIKHDYSLDSAGDIGAQSMMGAGGGVAQEAIASRVGSAILDSGVVGSGAAGKAISGIGGSALGGGVVGAVTSGLTSTYNNGELYRQGKETAGQATANTVVDTGVGLGAGLAGAAAGAAIGSVVPVAGTLIGGAVGFGVGYLGNMLAQNTGFTDWAKKGLGSELNQYNQELSGVWDGIGHATEGIHNAWDSTKGGIRHAGHAIADGASGAWHGAEHLGAEALHGVEHAGASVLHGAEHLGAEALHGIEHTGERAWHGAERLGSRALHGAEHLGGEALHLGSRALHGAEHAGLEVLHGGEHLASRALHGGERLLHNAEHLGERAWHGAEHAGANLLHGAVHAGAGVLHGVEHAGATALHTAEHLGAGALHGAEHAAHAVGDAASGAWHKLTSWF